MLFFFIRRTEFEKSNMVLIKRSFRSTFARAFFFISSYFFYFVLHLCLFLLLLSSEKLTATKATETLTVVTETSTVAVIVTAKTMSRIITTEVAMEWDVTLWIRMVKTLLQLN